LPKLAPPDPELLKRLRQALPKDLVLARAIDRLARASDASMYRIVPEVVVRPRDVGDVKALLDVARASGRGLTFRTAGTSLSGQAVGPGILVDLSIHWNRFRVEDEGRRVWAQPAVIGGFLNRVLHGYGRRIGPDPASIDSAMLGGIVSNNSSGMCCGVAQNSYRTIHGLELLLPDGTRLDTIEDGANQRVRDRAPRIAAGLMELKEKLRRDHATANFIRKKFATKNTMGYSLNAFLDYSEPADILTHLIVGSEGTLAFIAGISLDTVPDPRHRSTALAYFDELKEAGRAIAPLADAGAAALEIMDTASLRLMTQDGEIAHPVTIGEGTSAILIEFQEEDETALANGVARARKALERFALAAPAGFSSDEAGRARMWKLRKGLLARAGGSRGTGLAILNEDIAVPRDRLAEAIPDLHALFGKFGIRDAVVFGHAKDGNLHFIAPQDFRGEENVRNFDLFLRALADLIVGKYQGALKAEHGSGRNMAPFVQQEFGDAAYALMREVKQLFDPYGILNPGVLLSENKDAHVLDLKTFPQISAAADRCIECGFCERVCPSRTLTLTPRQRIIVRREMALLDAARDEGSRETLRELADDYAYAGLETCARDSMCGTVCPVKIDTSVLVKEVDASHASFARRLGADLAARNFGAVAGAARTGLKVAHGLPPALVRAGSTALHAIAPRLAPAIADPRRLPRPGAAPTARTAASGSERRVVYFPSCVTRIFGPDRADDLPTERAVVESLAAAGYDAIVPESVDSVCCGMSFSSQSQPKAARTAAGNAARFLWTASDNGKVDVLTDASPCALTLSTLVAEILLETGRAVRFHDFATWWRRSVLPHAARPALPIPRAVLHPTCSSIKLGSSDDFMQVARFYCDDARVPPSAACCGYAGDRGLFVPELTEAATRAEAEEVRALDAAAPHVSTCRTCEIGMSRATGRTYRSLAHLIHAATVAPAQPGSRT
jgi:D-lactate dehydrogenase